MVRTLNQHDKGNLKYVQFNLQSNKSTTFFYFASGMSTRMKYRNIRYNGISITSTEIFGNQKAIRMWKLEGHKFVFNYQKSYPYIVLEVKIPQYFESPINKFTQILEEWQILNLVKGWYYTVGPRERISLTRGFFFVSFKLISQYIFCSSFSFQLFSPLFSNTGMTSRTRFTIQSVKVSS